jgi:hypothetical protein
MNANLKFLLSVAMVLAATQLWADQVELLNGDRLSGKVLSVSASTVVLESDMLGRVSVPRKNIAALTMGTSAVQRRTAANGPATAVPVNPIPNPPATGLGGTNLDLNTSLPGTGLEQSVISQIRQQMLGDNPAAAAKFDELASGFMSGKLNLDDIRRQAKSAADQLRELKRENPEVADSLNAYLQVLDNFLNEPADKAQPH